mmetsp:Transcript_9393/g.11592  ORF Transcript_9393/g.11592 Transcript_9393/m.11592 type:complete len:111 (-) Transcript_9393:224-556(-)
MTNLPVPSQLSDQLAKCKTVREGTYYKSREKNDQGIGSAASEDEEAIEIGVLDRYLDKLRVKCVLLDYYSCMMHQGMLMFTMNNLRLWRVLRVVDSEAIIGRRCWGLYVY